MGEDTSDSKYGGGFAIRMVILLVLLGLVGFGFYYDRYVLAPQTEQKINEAFALLTKPTDDGAGIPKDLVHETVGFQPSETKEVEGYEVETYRFKRALPFLPGQYINVVYEHGALVSIIPNEQFDVTKVKEKVDLDVSPVDPSRLPAAAVAGGGGGGGGDDDDDDEETDRPETDDEDEEGQDDESDKNDDKSDDESKGDDESGDN